MNHARSVIPIEITANTAVGMGERIEISPRIEIGPRLFSIAPSTASGFSSRSVTVSINQLYPRK